MQTHREGKTLTDHSVGGFSWLAGQTILIRVVRYGSQIALAWLLEPSAFGVVGMALAIQAFVSLVQDSGIDKVLVADQARFEQFANPGFWISLTTGLLAALLLLLSIPLADRLLDSAQLSSLLLILVLAAPFKALWLIPNSKLKVDLRFDLIAAINIFAAILETVGAVSLALYGFGALSFVLPYLLVNPLIAAILFGITKLPLRFNPEFSKWPTLAKASGLLMITAVLHTIVTRGDYLIVGAVYSEQKVGIYYLAFALSVQSIMLIAKNVTNTLFPILSKLRNDTKRQYGAFIRTTRLAVFITTPITFLIAATAEPIVGLVLDD